MITLTHIFHTFPFCIGVLSTLSSPSLLTSLQPLFTMKWAMPWDYGTFRPRLRKLILQTCMRRDPVGLEVWLMVRPFVYFNTPCVRTAKALARLRRLVWAFAGRLCDKYHNLMSRLKWVFVDEWCCWHELRIVPIVSFSMSICEWFSFTCIVIGEDMATDKVLLTPGGYATDCFNVVALVSFLFCVTLLFLQRGVSLIFESYVSPCSRVFFSPVYV